MSESALVTQPTLEVQYTSEKSTICLRSSVAVMPEMTRSTLLACREPTSEEKLMGTISNSKPSISESSLIMSISSPS